MKSRLFLAAVFCSLLFTGSCGIQKSLKDRPEIANYNSALPEKEQINDSTFEQGNNFLTKNKQGLWELYLEGNPLQRGLANGNLTQALYYKQEKVFLDKVNSLVPSEGKQKFLTKFLQWYNRKMYQHIPEAYKTEIYGVSQYASNEFNNLAPPYLRALYLHGAHDIGHALQDLMLVGCTSFAAWNEKTEDGNLLIARNFDFYAGDDFAQDKIVAFVNPDKGYPFMSVTWGGFIGVVSGMNNQGLTVTINAGKSKIPLVAKTPISLVTREILQYASNIDEAIAIAKSREVFVSESIMIGSAKDNKAVLIEVSPSNFGVYEVANSNTLICANHFQSEAYEKDRRNKKTMEKGHTTYRFNRMSELLQQEAKVNPHEAVDILRNREGLNDTPLGYGNEKAINQLLAHHGIVFQPEDLKVWVSSNPYQLGAFVCYDLNVVFAEKHKRLSYRSISEEKKLILASPFLQTAAYHNYESYRILEKKVETAIANKATEIPINIDEMVRLNPNYWKAHYLAGRYHFERRNFKEAMIFLTEASQKEIPSQDELVVVQKYLRKAARKQSK